MNLLFNNHVKLGNKWLILLSGLNKNAVDRNGNKVYEYKNFNLPTQWRETKWSKTMIKQILAYFGLSNSQGELGIVDLEELAQILNCSIRSLQNNNKKFIELGLIKEEALYGNLVCIKFVNYQYNVLDIPSENSVVGSTGFTRIKREALFELFKIKNVNVLRIACRAFYLQEKEVNLGGNPSILLPSETLKGMLPKYYTYRPLIERALRKLARLFEVDIFDVIEDGNKILKEHKPTPTIIEKFKSPYIVSMKLRPVFDSHKIMKEESCVFYTMDLKEVYEETGMEEVSTHSIDEMILEYGKDAVLTAFHDIVSCFRHDYESVTHTGQEAFHDIQKLKWCDKPVGILRRIFEKYSLHYQEGYLFQP